MKAAVFYGPKDMRVEERPLPHVDNDEALIKVKAASICGTDLHIFNGDLEVDPPLILGHDFSGTIEKIEKKYEPQQIGDNVSAHIVKYCGDCLFCKQGRYSLCLNSSFIGFQIDGSFAEYVVVPIKNITPIPPGVSLDEAAILEPIVMALRVMDFIHPQIGETIAIFGQGPIGLVQTQVAKLSGLCVFAIDLQNKRLDLASDFGADHVLNPCEEDVVDSILKLTNGVGVDSAVEASGSQKAINQASKITKSGGKILFVGDAKGLHGPPIHHRERISIGVRVDPRKYPLALKLLAEKRVDVQSLVTQEIKLDEIVRYFVDLSKKDLEAVKVLVKP